MLTITSVNPTGFFSYGIHKTIQVDSLGLVLLEGKNNNRSGNANGAGKTSFFNAITTILFDENPLDCSAETATNSFLGKCFGKVGLTDDNGQKWRIICTRKWRKTDKYPDPEFDAEPSEWHLNSNKYSGTDLYLERWDQIKNVWVDERATNVAGEARLDVKSTRKKIIDIIKVDYRQFMAVAYLAQQQSIKFINGTHKERMQAIAELGDISVWDKRRDLVREEIKVNESEVDRLRSVIDGASRASGIMVEPSTDTLNKLNEDLVTVTNEIKRCDDEIKRIADEKITWAAMVADLDDKIKIASNDQGIRHLLTQRNDLERQQADLSTFYNGKYISIRNRQQNPEIDQLQLDINTNSGYITARRFDLEQLLPGSGKCPRCRSTVTDDHLVRQRELMTMDINEHEAKNLTLRQELKTLQAAWADGIKEELSTAEREFINNKNIISQALINIDTKIQAHGAQIEELRRKRNELPPSPDAQLRPIMNERMAHLNNQSRIKESIQSWRDSLSAWIKYRATISDTQTKINSLEDKLKYARAIERLFGDKGIKAHKLGVIIDQLNIYIQRFLDILTEQSVQAWITPFRQKSDGNMTADIQIMVKEGEKTSVPFDLYSGGEKQQIVLAFIGAFWQVATLQGAGVNILCLDEIFGQLDEQNSLNVFQYLDYIKSQGKSSIFVVTHNQEIKYQLNFDKQWIVEKTDHMSVLHDN